MIESIWQEEFAAQDAHRKYTLDGERAGLCRGFADTAGCREGAAQVVYGQGCEYDRDWV